MSIERTDYIAEAITEAFGERCPDFAEGCACCEAWQQYDRLREERDMWKGRAEAAVMIGRSLTGARALSAQVEERE